MRFLEKAKVKYSNPKYSCGKKSKGGILCLKQMALLV